MDIDLDLQAQYERELAAAAAAPLPDEVSVNRSGVSGLLEGWETKFMSVLSQDDADI